jgi:hypothetical protein
MSVVAFGYSSILVETQQGMTYCHQKASISLKLDAIVGRAVAIIFERAHDPGSSGIFAL